jgi:3-oxoacyl-[acyl-carrier-protein] synthase II
MMQKVVVTGMGVVSPVGNSCEELWKALSEGRSGIGPITHFDSSELSVTIAAECGLVEPEGMNSKDLRRRDRYTLYALYASDEALKQSGLDITKENPMRCGVVLGSGIGGLETIEEQHLVYIEKGPARVSPMMIPKILSNMAAGEVAIRHGLQGPNKAVVTACASGAQSISDAVNTIRLGFADVMLAGGSEAGVVPFGVAGFAAIKALSRRNDDPLRASRPFDLDRDGFVIGEGAGLLVLESEEHAKARGAAILAEIAGYGETCDAFHITAPRPDGSGAAGAMNIALSDARVNPEDVDYFNAHGTSTKYNDISEALALKTVFGDNMPPVSSSKSMIGHLLGAAGAVEAVACVLSIQSGVLHPNVNYETPDPECPINVIANEAREADVRVIMSNSLGFGGHNASLIIRKYDG